MDNSLPEILDGKNINFLIGSGTGVPLFPTLSLGEKLPSFEEIVSSKKLSMKNNMILYCYYYAKWISPMQLHKMGSSGMNYISVSKQYRIFISTLLEILTRGSNEKPKRANIFTTNYDLLFENTFDYISQHNPLCYFNDGSRGFIARTLDTDNFYLNVSHSGNYDNYNREVPTINLFKMHGSISWEKLDNKIIISYKNSVLSKADKCLLEIENFDLTKIDKIFSMMEPNIELNASISDLDKQLDEIDLDVAQVKKFFKVYENLPIINPNKWKFHDTVFDQHYYQLIRAFSYEMEKRDVVLVIFGFSFADEHLLDIFKRSMLNPSLQVIIICYNNKQKKDMRHIFEGYNNITYLPSSFRNDQGNPIHGDFRFLNNLLRGEKDD